MKIKKGELFVLTEGEYSDYSILCAMKALKDFEFKWKNKISITEKEFDDLCECPQKYLIENGYAEYIEYKELACESSFYKDKPYIAFGHSKGDEAEEQEELIHTDDPDLVDLERDWDE